MSIKGVDIDALRSLVSQMGHCQSDISGVVSSLTAELDSLPWYGPDRTRFEQEWHAHVSGLQDIVQALVAAAAHATQHAAEQERISGGSW